MRVDLELEMGGGSGGGSGGGDGPKPILHEHDARSTTPLFCVQVKKLGNAVAQVKILSVFISEPQLETSWANLFV